MRNVYPDLSWTYHELPDGLLVLHVDRGGFDGALRARLVAVGARRAWNARVIGVRVAPTRPSCGRRDGVEHTRVGS